MRGGWLVLLFVVPALSGCTTSEGGGFFDFITGGAALEGECGHAFVEDWDKQIILKVEWTESTQEKVSPRALEVTATYFGKTNEASARESKPYATKFVDGKGCISFPVDEEGGYSFWAFAETETDYCYVDGRLDGTYNGQPVVEGKIVIDRYFGADHC